MTDLAAAVREGALLGAAFNPLTSLVGSVVSASLLATGHGLRRALEASSVLLLAALMGDGLAVIRATQVVADGAWLVDSSAIWPSWVALAIWVAVGLSCGYLVPTWVGAFAGRRVTWGTGWLTAAAFAAGVSAIFADIARSFG